MKIPKIISLAGYKESGKDAIADYLVSEYGYRKAAFAESLKKVVSSWIGSNMYRNYIPDDVPEHINALRMACVLEWGQDSLAEYVSRKPYSDNLRRLLQYVGTEYYRSKDAYYWVKSMKLDPDRKYVITDMRFQNEGALMRAYGAALVRVIDPAQKNTDRHQSEVEVDQVACHYRIVNKKDGLENVPGRVEQALDFFDDADLIGVQMETFNDSH